jgi:hypothetical protein
VRTLVLALATAGMLAGIATPAVAAAAGPKIPDLTDCHEVNRLLGIDNVRDCSGS